MSALTIGESEGRVDALLLRPRDAVALYVMAHGSGAGMTESFANTMALRLAAHRIATLRFQFPYMQAGSRKLDPDDVLMDTVRRAVDRARLEGLPVFAGGKSMGGRMTSEAAARGALPGVHGIVFLGFPLHPDGRPAVARAAHLARVPHPMLFLQGTRDTLADLSLLRPIVDGLPKANLVELEGADHKFRVLESSACASAVIFGRAALRCADWMRERLHDATTARARPLMAHRDAARSR